MWLKDGSFLWLSERSGCRHSITTQPTARSSAQVTSGHWELRTLHGVDEAGGWVYFSGTERSPIGGDVYRDQAGRLAVCERLSTADGTHSRGFSPAFAYYVDTWSDVTTPPQVRLHAERRHRGARHRGESVSRRSTNTGCRSRNSCR